MSVPTLIVVTKLTKMLSNMLQRNDSNCKKNGQTMVASYSCVQSLFATERTCEHFSRNSEFLHEGIKFINFIKIRVFPLFNVNKIKKSLNKYEAWMWLDVGALMPTDKTRIWLLSECSNSWNYLVSYLTLHFPYLTLRITVTYFFSDFGAAASKIDLIFFFSFFPLSKTAVVPHFGPPCTFFTFFFSSLFFFFFGIGRKQVVVFQNSFFLF